MSNETKAVIDKPDRAVTEYQPFGGSDKIKLSLAIVQKLICVPTKSGAICSDNDAIKFIAMCQARKLNPFEGDAFLIGYDSRDKGPTFSLITAHQAFLKRAELHPEFDGMESGVVVRDAEGKLMEVEGDFVDDGLKLLGGWARVYFKTRKHPMYKRIKLERFKKGFGVWVDDPAGMIVKCAEADALRSSFPTMLGGLYMKEEIQAQEQIKGPDFAAPSATPLFQPTTENGNKPQDDPETHLTRVRRHCTLAGIKEAELLAWMGETGATDGSQATLDEVPAKVLEITVNNWSDIAAKVNVREGGNLL